MICKSFSSFLVKVLTRNTQTRNDVLGKEHFKCDSSFLRNHVTLHRFVAQLPDLHTLLCKPSLRFRNENNFPCAEFNKVDNHWISCGALSCLFQLFMVRLRSRTIVFFQRTSVWLAASTDYLRPVQQAVNFETESDDEAFQMEILLKFALS